MNLPSTTGERGSNPAVNLLLVLVIVLMIILGGRWSPHDAGGRKPLISAYSVVLAGFALYVAFPGALLSLNNWEYVWAPSFGKPATITVALLVCIAGLASFYTGTLLASRSASAPRNQVETTTLHGRSGSYEPVAWIFLVIGLLIRFRYIGTAGGLESTIIGLSGYFRDANGLHSGEAEQLALRNLAGIADAAATFLLVCALTRGRSRILYSALFLLVITSGFATSGKRLVIILPLTLVALAVDRYVYPLRLSLAPLALLGGLVMGMASLFFRIFLPAALSNIGVDLSKVSYAEGSPLLFYLNSLEFSTLEMIDVSIQARQEIADMFGGRWQTFIQTWLTPATYAVPRTLWPDKPNDYYDVSYAVSSLVEGGRHETATVGYATTILGSSYVVAGIAGVVVSLILLGVLVRKFDNFWLTSGWSMGRAFSYSLMITFAFQLFRQGSVGWALVVSVVNQVGFIVGLLLILWVGGSRQAISPQYAGGAERSRQ